MTSTSYFTERNGAIPDLLSPSTPTTASAPRSSALSSRITSVLSASYADLDLRDALETLDTRGFQNTQESRRNLRLDLQQEVIKSNGEIIQDFGQVAEVRTDLLTLHRRGGFWLKESPRGLQFCLSTTISKSFEVFNRTLMSIKYRQLLKSNLKPEGCLVTRHLGGH